MGDTAATAAAPDTMEQAEAVEQKKPTRKRAAQRPREPQNFFDFFFNQSNGNRPNTSRSNAGRSNTAQSNGFRPFF
jgi:membrane protein involved in colicin uptake